MWNMGRADVLQVGGRWRRGREREGIKWDTVAMAWRCL
jgi:hypothetical protein